MTHPEAHAWFAAAADGRVRLPAHPNLSSRGDGAEVEVSQLVREPEGEEVSTALFLPFLPKTQATVVAKGLFGTIASQVAEDIRAASRWLADNLFFDLQNHAQYQGGVFLTKCQAVIRDVDVYRATREGADVELVRIRRWPGTDLAGHRLFAVERRALGSGKPNEQPVTGSLLEVVASPRQDRTAAAILHPEHGICWFHGPMPWLRSIIMDVSLHGETRRVVQDVNERGAPLRHFEVRRLHRPSLTSLLGDAPDHGSPAAREAKADAGRRETAVAETLGLRWFDDQDAAQAAIRDVIAGATRTLLIFDPYLGPLELRDFVLAVTSDEVAVTLVISPRGFNAGRSGGEAAAVESTMENFLAEMNAKAWGRPDVLVTSGKKEVHDRFIVVDGQVWLSGNSLNNIGDRASVVIKIPNPQVVLEKLQPFIDGAKPFDVWLADRRAARNRNPGPDGSPGGLAG
jgi:hypothetical protein